VAAQGDLPAGSEVQIGFREPQRLDARGRRDVAERAAEPVEGSTCLKGGSCAKCVTREWHYSA